jgi:hypothetical protein
MIRPCSSLAFSGLGKTITIVEELVLSSAENLKPFFFEKVHRKELEKESKPWIKANFVLLGTIKLCFYERVRE